jgi:hypothetical protein
MGGIMIDLISKYLLEAEDEDEAKLNPEDTAKVFALATILDKKDKLSIMRRAISKALLGKSIVEEKEKEMLSIIVRFIFSPDKAKFKRIMRKI